MKKIFFVLFVAAFVAVFVAAHGAGAQGPILRVCDPAATVIIPRVTATPQCSPQEPERCELGGTCTMRAGAGGAYVACAWVRAANVCRAFAIENHFGTGYYDKAVGLYRVCGINCDCADGHFLYLPFVR